MLTQDAVNTAATGPLAHPGSGTANDAEPEGLEPSQDGSIRGAMSSQADDDTDVDAVEGVGDDEGDDGESEGFSPKLQRKLKEGAEARKRLSDLETKFAEAEQQAKAFKYLLEAPNGPELLKQFRSGQGGEAAAAPSIEEDFIPAEDFGFDQETKKGLDGYMKAALGRFVSVLERKLQPVVAEVGQVKSQRVASEWSGLAKEYGEIDRWKPAYDKFRANGMSPKAALAAASEGEAMRRPAAQKAASAEAQRLTRPTLTGRSQGGVRPRTNVETNFLKFLEQDAKRRP